MPRTWTDEDLIREHRTARSVRAIVCALDLCPNGGNAATIKKHLTRLGLSIPSVKAKKPAQRMKEWRERNPEKVKSYNDRYRANNLDKFAQYARDRRALKASAQGSFTLEEFKALCEEHNNKCLCCGTMKKLTVDHIVPLSKGGSHSIDNIQPLCGSCNSKKSDKTIDFRSAA